LWGWFPVPDGSRLVTVKERDILPMLLDGLIRRTDEGYTPTGTGLTTGLLAPGTVGSKIFIVCTPKSGSSFVVTLLQKITGYGHMNPVARGEEMLEGDPDPRSMESEAAQWPSVSQLHCYAKPKTIRLCEKYSIKPIFLTRNIFDSLLSMKEYIDEIPHKDFFAHYYALTTEDDKRAFIINVYAPIIVRIAASWHAAFREQRVPVYFETYEHFFADPMSATRKMLGHLDLYYPDEKIRDAIAFVQGETTATKFNKGVSGRGMSAFTKPEQERILALVGGFKGFDATCLT
jgi:hypothetical protein